MMIENWELACRDCFKVGIVYQEEGMKEKILIVDDDHETVEFLRILLVRQGYHPLVAENGIKALEIANKEIPDLIILDVMIPALDGYEVARSLHRRPETALIPILMFTARAQPEDKVTGYEVGVDLYLTKPIHPLDLQANIRALLTQRQSRRAVLAEQGYLVGVLSAKGGSGVSTLALNLAVTMARQNNVRVTAVELRPGLGSWNEELNINSKSGMTNLLKLDVPEINQNKIESQLTDTPFGVRLLLAGGESSGDSALSTSVHQYEVVTKELLTISKVVILDLGTPFLPAFPLLLELCNEVIVVTEPSFLGVRQTARLISELREKGFGAAKMINLVTVNRTRSDRILSLTQVENALHQSVTLGFPPVMELADHANQIGQPLCLLHPESLISTQFTKLSEIIFKHIGK
jgi:pilus assembly protein CpaE